MALASGYLAVHLAWVAGLALTCWLPRDWSRLASGAFSALVHATVFGLATWYRFATNDIIS